MLGERSDQRGLWEADRLMGRESFYGLLAPAVPRRRIRRVLLPRQRPSLLATALLLQSHDKVDAEAKAPG